MRAGVWGKTAAFAMPRIFPDRKTLRAKFLQKEVAFLREKANKALAVVIRNWWTPQDNVGGSLKPGSREQASILVR
jgi:hypothetical protein